MRRQTRGTERTRPRAIRPLGLDHCGKCGRRDEETHDANGDDDIDDACSKFSIPLSFASRAGQETFQYANI